MNKEKRIAILSRLRKNNPYPSTELKFSSPFELLISALLSAKSTDVSVNKATAKLYQIANNPERMLMLGVEGIKTHIKTIGLFNTKARNIIQICHMLIELHNSKVPENRSALEEMPGIGRKIANVVLNIAFGWNTIAVDTHVFRVCNRTGFSSGKTTKQVEEKLIKVIPEEFKINFHHWFVFHGRYTCTARKLHCNFCIINDLCEFKKKVYI